MPPYLPHAFKTETSVLLTLIVVELGSSHSLHAECVGIRHQVIITELPRVKDARYLATFIDFFQYKHLVLASNFWQLSPCVGPGQSPLPSLSIHFPTFYSNF